MNYRTICAVLLFAVVVTADSQTFGQDVVFTPAPDMSNYLKRLARSIELIGENRVEEGFEELETHVNPAFRSPAALETFRESWMKLFLPLGRARMQFESYDVVGYERVSNQAYYVYGIANGANGPMVFDFRVFRYDARWHVHGFTFRAGGWTRDPKLPETTTLFDQPLTYTFGKRAVAAVDGSVAEGVAAE